MSRHLLDVSQLSREDIDRIFTMAAEGPLHGALVGRTCLTAFFQESTRTRLGFMSAAARLGAGLIDLGDVGRLRIEAQDDQALVLATLADIAVVRHWDPLFLEKVTSRGICSVVNAGSGAASHPSQSLIDAYVLAKVFSNELDGVRVLFLGPLLRSAISFVALSAVLGMQTFQTDPPAPLSSEEQDEVRSLIDAADVVYIQSMSGTCYEQATLNDGPIGRELPQWVLNAITESRACIMHALPRGPELPDRLMWHQRSLIADQVEHGVAVRSAVLRWLVEPA